MPCYGIKQTNKKAGVWWKTYEVVDIHAEQNKK